MKIYLKLSSLIISLLLLTSCSSKKNIKPDLNKTRISSKSCTILKELPVIDSEDSTENSYVYDEEVGAYALDITDENIFDESILKKPSEEVFFVEEDDQEVEPASLKTIYFDFDKYDLKKDQVENLRNNLSKIKDLVSNGYKIVLEGHSCNFGGSSNYNMMLSEKRAESVAKELIKNGIDKKKIFTVGFGAEKRLVEFGDKNQQAPNRRVETKAYKIK